MGSFLSKSLLNADPATLSDGKWDYVIVGGGTAGCVLASRLSEDPNVSVLLIEAGATQTKPLFSRIPIAFYKLFKSAYDWNLETTPQSHMNARKLYWPRGKMLGGSSSMNALMYHHCAPADFDEWAQHCSGDWSYKHLHPYLIKAERFSPSTSVAVRRSDRQVFDLNQRGQNGLWETRWGQALDICDDALDACIEVGIPYSPDFNTPKGTLGANLFPGFVTSTGERSSAYTAYIKPEVLQRKNLTVLIGCIGTKIVFNKSPELKATGVEIARTDSNGKEGSYIVHANKEVIVSSGAVATPQLLMLSGIGPRADLEKLGIPIVQANDNVGANLFDHLATGVAFRAAPNTSLAYLDKPIYGIPALLRWLVTGGGIYSSIAAQGAAFVRTDDSKLPYASPLLKTADETYRTDAPDGELIWLPGPYISHGLIPPPPEPEIFTIAAVGLKPQSHGTIKLRSTNPFEMPVIDPNYLATESDVNVMIKLTRLCMNIARAGPLRNKLQIPSVPPHGTAKDSVFWPGDIDPEAISDEDMRDFVKRNGETLYHPVGTARMSSDPSKSVVSPKLVVNGIPNLRIVDASIFPTQISGHPTAPIIALAERAADIIKGKI